MAILRLELHEFDEGPSLAIIELAIDPNTPSTQAVSPELLQETVFALTHSATGGADVYQGRLYFSADVSSQGGQIIASGGENEWSTNLGELCSCLIGRAPCAKRFNHFTVAVMDESSTVSQREVLASAIADRASLAHRLAKGSAFFEVENVVFATTLGGSCVVVDGADNPKFTRRFIPNSFLPKYLPIFMHNMRAFYWLSSLYEEQQDVLRIPKEKRFDAITLVVTKVHAYRLGDRASSAGFVTPHRTFHKRLRNALELPTMEAELFNDANDARNFIEHQLLVARERREVAAAQKWAWISVILAVLGASVVAIEIVHSIISFMYSDQLLLLAAQAVVDDSSAIEFRRVAERKHNLELIGYIAAATVALLAGFAAHTSGGSHVGGKHG